MHVIKCLSLPGRLPHFHFGKSQTWSFGAELYPLLFDCSAEPSHGESHVLMHNSDIKIIFSRYFTEYISWLHPNHPSYYAGILYGSVQLGPVLYLHLRLLSPSGPGYQHMTLSSIKLTSPCHDGCISNGHLISSSRLFIFSCCLIFWKTFFIHSCLYWI